MKLSKFFTVMGMVTIISLCYVYQQTQIFLLSYKHGKDRIEYQNLLDKNISLKYSLEKVKSVSYIGNKIFSDTSSFEMPDDSHVGELEVAKEEAVKVNSLPHETLLSKIFDAKLEVEAKTIR